MKYFIFGDVHSYFNEWIEALQEAGFDPLNEDHAIISLGDLLDRGPNAQMCLDFVNNLPDNRKILIKGNHEDLMIDAINRGYFKSHDYHNMTNDTVKQLTGLEGPESLEAMKDNESWNKYYNGCVDYYELDDNIFVHGWIPFIEWIDENNYYIPNVEYIYFAHNLVDTKNWKNGYWKKARWYNGMWMWSEGVRLEGKTIWCGHWHTSWGHCNLHNDGVEFLGKYETMYIDPETGKTEPHANFDPFIDEGIVAMDGCTVYSGKVNVVKLEI